MAALWILLDHLLLLCGQKKIILFSAGCGGWGQHVVPYLQPPFSYLAHLCHKLNIHSEPICIVDENVNFFMNTTPNKQYPKRLPPPTHMWGWFLCIFWTCCLNHSIYICLHLSWYKYLKVALKSPLDTVQRSDFAYRSSVCCVRGHCEDSSLLVAIRWLNVRGIRRKWFAGSESSIYSQTKVWMYS